MTLVNGAGVGYFHFHVRQSQSGGKPHQRCTNPESVEIARLSLPHLKRGLNECSAGFTARIIIELTGVDAVAITDRETKVGSCRFGCRSSLTRTSVSH